MRKHQRRHHGFEIDEAARRAAIEQLRAEHHTAEGRFSGLCTQLLRTMLADHAALKAIVREMRDCHHTALNRGGTISAAWAEDNIASNPFDFPLRELLLGARTAAYRYSYARKRDKPYLDLALSFIRGEVAHANAMLFALLHSPEMRIRGDGEEVAR